MAYKIKRSSREFLSSNYKEYEFQDKGGNTYLVEGRNRKEALIRARKKSGMKDLNLIEIYSW